jgi:hypothetical protein
VINLHVADKNLARWLVTINRPLTYGEAKDAITVRCRDLSIYVWPVDPDARRQK